jgi:phage-related protein
MIDEPSLKPVIWIGSSRRDLREFPEPVQDHIGYALYVAQLGGKHRDTKTMRGFGGAGVVEIITVYSALQKKSKTGVKTPRRDIELIRQRLREAEQIAKEMKP